MPITPVLVGLNISRDLVELLDVPTILFYHLIVIGTCCYIKCSSDWAVIGIFVCVAQKQFVVVVLIEQFSHGIIEGQVDNLRSFVKTNRRGSVF